MKWPGHLGEQTQQPRCAYTYPLPSPTQKRFSRFSDRLCRQEWWWLLCLHFSTFPSLVVLFCLLGTGDRTEGLAYARQGLSTELQTSLSPSYFFSNAGTITVTEPCILSFQLEMPLMARLIERHITKEKLETRSIALGLSLLVDVCKIGLRSQKQRENIILER